MNRPEQNGQDHRRAFWRWKWLIALTTLAGLGGAIFFSSNYGARQDTIYQGTATVMIIPPMAAVDPAVPVQATADKEKERTLQTQVRLMQSRNVMRHAVEKINSGAKAPVDEASLDLQVATLERSITISPVPSTNIVEVHARSTDPKLAQQRANAVVNAYIDYVKEAQTQAVQDALKEVESRLEALRQDTTIHPSVTSLLPSIADQVEEVSASLESSAVDLRKIRNDVAGPAETIDVPLALETLVGAVGGLEAVSVRLLALERNVNLESGESSIPSLLATFDENTNALRVAAEEVRQAAPGGGEQSERLRTQADLLVGLAAELQRAIDQARTLNSGDQQETDADSRLIGEGRKAVAALTSINSALQSARSPQMPSAAFGRLLTAEGYVRAASVHLKSGADALEGHLNGAVVSLEERLAAIRMDVEETHAGLKRTLAGITPAGGPAPLTAPSVDRALFRTTVGLEVISQQLSGLQDVSAVTSDRHNEIEAVAQMVDSTREALGGVMASLHRPPSAPPEDSVGPGLDVSLLSLADRIRIAIGALKYGAGQLMDLSKSEVDIETARALGEAEERIQVGTRMINAVAADMRKLEPQVPLGQLDQVMLASTRTGQSAERLTESATQLERLFNGTRDPSYQDLVQRRQELDLLLLNPQNTGISIVDSAIVAQANRFSVLPMGIDTIVPMGAVAGLLLGLLGALTMELLDRKVRGADSLAKSPVLQAVGLVPRTRRSKNAPPPTIEAMPRSAFSQALHSLATSVEESLNQGPRTILVTSPSASEGKTTIATNLAAAFARRRRQVLLVDANLHRSDTSRAMGLEKNPGLATALALRTDPFDLLVETNGMHVLPAGLSRQSPAELLATPDMQMFLAHAAARFDIVIVDGPPCLGFAETRVLSRETGAVLLVVKNGTTTLDAARLGQEDLESVGARVLGCVLNFMPAKSVSYPHQYARTHTSRGWWPFGGKEPAVAASASMPEQPSNYRM